MAARVGVVLEKCVLRLGPKRVVHRARERGMSLRPVLVALAAAVLASAGSVRVSGRAQPAQRYETRVGRFTLHPLQRRGSPDARRHRNTHRKHTARSA